MSATGTILNRIFERIDTTYDLDLEVDVQDFLLSRDEYMRLGAPHRGASVLVQQQSTKELRLGVYITEESLDKLSGLDLSRDLPPRSFAALCEAIEELSHFAYLVFNASAKRRVTQLELELQAEVDKYLTTALMIASNNGGRVPHDLMDRLFEDFCVRDDLDGRTRDRYLDASSFASRYCYHLNRRLTDRSKLRSVLSEIRRFYRLSQLGKIDRIQDMIHQRERST